MQSPLVYYRGFRPRLLATPQYRHILLLLFWPLFGLSFHFFENIFSPTRWHIMHCALDDVIPFCEWFIIPYVLWFAYLFFGHAYTFFFDVPAFKRMMSFLISTYVISLVIFAIYPSAQFMRPQFPPRDNPLCQLVFFFYSIDTYTNVCPSLHVVGSMAMMFGLWDTERFKTRNMKIVTFVFTMSICFSTVFVKQHSMINVVAGFLVSYAVYKMVYQGGYAQLQEHCRTHLARYRSLT